MSGVGEASLVLGIISSIISIVTAAKNIYDAANDASGLPKAFHKVAAKLPIVVLILEQANEYIRQPQIEQATRDAFGTVLSRCELSAKELREIFARALPKDGSSRVDKYLYAAKKIGQGSRVQELISDILQEIELLLASSSFATQQAVGAVERALGDFSATESSLQADLTIPPPRNLQQIQYSDGRIHKRSSDLKLFLDEWLLSDGLSVSKIATEHDAYLQKRFHNPNTAYASCQWFFKVAEYQQFVKVDSSRVLRIKGSPGCGKSVLIASIIHHLETSYLPDGGSGDVLYCYCSDDTEQNSAMALVRVLLAQALRCATPEMILEFKKVNTVHPVLKAHDMSRIEGDLWRLLRTVLSMRDRKTFIIVDGIDNCAQPLICARSLMKVTTTLASRAQCGLLLSSRLDRRDFFDSKSMRTSTTKNDVECFQLEITEELTRQDLVEFVSYQVSTRPSFLSSSQMIRDKIITSVCSRAHGMFLYASLALEDLKGETISSVADVDMTLANLPADLFKGYKKHLQLPIGSRRGQEAFNWIFWVNSSMTWNEFRSALAIGEGEYNENHDILDSCETFIEHTCGQLVESFGDANRLRFIHPTVTEFLECDTESGDRLNIRSGPSMIASKLLTFLEYPDLPSFASPITQKPRETIQEYTNRTGRGLYIFAISNWYKYLKKCDKSQDRQLEVQVRRFLRSESFVRWLKTAVILSRISHEGQDSVSLTADVVDSLQSWVSGRSWALEDSELNIQSWIKHFLDLMLDWGKVIAFQPDWIHFLHQQLLPDASSFRNILEDNNSDQAIIQFDLQPISTKRSEPTTWPNGCFATDLEKDLAFTFDAPFISCYHIKTGMMTAEVLVPVPPRVQGPLVVRRGLLSPQGKYLAVLFEALGPSTDPVGNMIREGRRLHLNMATTGFKWGMDDASLCFDLSEFLAQMALGVKAAEFVICLLELRHTGPARTHLFGIPSWTTSPVIATGTQTMRWDLDDVDVFQFSDDCSKLITTFGTFNIESGQTQKHWQFALGQLYQGGKVSRNLNSFATVLRDIEGHCIVQFFDLDNAGTRHDSLPSREVRFTGVVHLLAVSSHGRFLLLTRREVSAVARRTKSQDGSRPTQKASIGVWDCRDGEWTPLLLLDRKFVNRLPNWNFFPYIFQPCFSPEASTDAEVNRVFLCVPSRWKLSGNVRTTRPLNPAESHLLLFESKRFVQGFGKNPALKLQLPTAAFSSRSSGVPTLKFLSWNPSFDEATIYQDNSIRKLDHEQLKTSCQLSTNTNIASLAPIVSAKTQSLEYYSALIRSQTGFATFYVRISVDISDTNTQHLIDDATDVSAELKTHRSITYEIAIACLWAGEPQARNLFIKHSPSSMICHPQIGRQFVCSADENSISIGFIELDLSPDDESPPILVNDSGDVLFQRAIECFRLRSHPLNHHSTQTSAVGAVDSAGTPRYIIFTESQTTFEDMSSLSEDHADIFVIKGDTSTQDSQHIFQVWRHLKNSLGRVDPREATQCEICLFVYDEDTEDITWMLHTTTGGDISGSRERLPDAAWALHPKLPLLAWLLPGHRLRISNIGGYGAPLTIAESLKVDVESAHAMFFSTDGRYLIVQAQENFKNDLMSLQRSRHLWGVILCDLHEGTATGAALVSDSPVSVDARDEVLCTYRLTRDGAVESTTYTLPGLILTQRQFLTFIPDGCCCSTCGQGFDSQCNVSVVENDGGVLAILGHTKVGFGRTTMNKEVCQPLMIRITTPPVELDVNGIQEAVLSVGSKRLFPALLDDQGQVLDNAFSPGADDPRKACMESQEGNCYCEKCLLKAMAQDNPLDVSWIPQMATNISDFKLPSGLPVPPEQVEDLHGLSEKAGIKDTCIWEHSDQSARDSIERMKGVLGDETFPWDSWAEFKEAMEEMKDDFDLEKYMNHMFEPGNCGSGCKIPLFVHTFRFDDSDEPNGFHWSSATTTGWLEEDLVWYYERFFNGSFEGARCWYEFPAYKALSVKMDKLNQDKTAKGRRFRRYFGSRTDKQGKILDSNSPDKDSEDVFEKDGIRFDDEMKPMITGLIFKDIFESMSDLVPGLGEVFEQRMHTMFSQSMIENLMD
ncbi:hypothetical protein BKA64DRAFT_679367 [Cadophora sp. MPI-SDFR-AT-0126]|nr:hypothetical protein BKA64DRAFT_679367 [Leotiomycetes sp. MPI-SDFR-AT-0126]